MSDIEFKLQVWEKYGLDGVIAPVQAIPQLPHGSVRHRCLLYLA
jgi:hypothetical protein